MMVVMIMMRMMTMMIVRKDMVMVAIYSKEWLKLIGR